MNVSTRRRTGIGIALVALVLLAGCAGGAQLAGGGGDGGEGAQSGAVAESGGDAGGAATQAAAPEEEGGDGGGEGGDGSGPAQVRQRSIIRTGQVHLRVEDFDAAQRNLTRTVRGYGGFVSDSQVEVERVDNETYKRGQLVLRVPRENFSTMLNRAQAVGEVESVSKNSKDVTDQLVDIEARLENLRAERDRLRQLYRNASDTEDILAVEERLAEVQGEIERLEARQQSLQRQVALSTIRVDLHEPRPDPGPIDTDRWFDTPILAAFLQSVNGVITSLRALVVAGAYGLPYAVVYGPVLVGAGYVVRRWRRGRRDGRGRDGGRLPGPLSRGSAPVSSPDESPPPAGDESNQDGTPGEADAPSDGADDAAEGTAEDD